MQKCNVVVYPLKVKKLLQNWKEKNQRTRKWFSVEQASSRVHEPFLQGLILDLQLKGKSKIAVDRMSVCHQVGTKISLNENSTEN